MNLGRSGLSTYIEAICRASKSTSGASHRGLTSRWVGAYSSQKGLAPQRGQCHQSTAGVPPMYPDGWRPLQKPFALLAENVITRLKFLVDLPM